MTVGTVILYRFIPRKKLKTTTPDRAQRMRISLFVLAVIPVIMVLVTLVSASWYLVLYGPVISVVLVGGFGIVYCSFELLKYGPDR